MKSTDRKENLKVAYQDARVAQNYDKDRDFRATDVSLHYETEIICLREILQEIKGPILEVAIGTGRLCRRLKDIGPPGMDYIGLDISLPMLQEAKKSLGEPSAQFDTHTGRPVHLLRADAFQMPFTNERFHAVIGFRFIKHLTLPNRHLIYKEIHRVLVEGGLLVFDFHGWRKRAISQEAGHRLTPKDLRVELEENGFQLTTIYGTRHLLTALLSYPFRLLKLKTPVKALGFFEFKVLSPLDALIDRSRGGIAVAKKISKSGG